MNDGAEQVLAYLGGLPPERRQVLARLRTMILRAAPAATETFQHGMPTYDLNGTLFALAAEKSYLALYVWEPKVLERLRPRLGRLDSGTGCIRFQDFNDLAPDLANELLRGAVAGRLGPVRPARPPAAAGGRRPPAGPPGRRPPPAGERGPRRPDRPGRRRPKS
ncbi:MAG: DUF1801 domain-containing protein [Acidobacteria bacterium]|nr:DUF1801 domain-containing protein [Acidobacteriota bacterium]